MPVAKNAVVVTAVEVPTKEVKKARYGSVSWIEGASYEELKSFAKKQTPPISLSKGADVVAMRITIKRVLAKRRSEVAKGVAAKRRHGFAPSSLIEEADVPADPEPALESEYIMGLKQELTLLRAQLLRASQVSTPIVFEEPKVWASNKFPEVPAAPATEQVVADPEPAPEPADVTQVIEAKAEPAPEPEPVVHVTEQQLVELAADFEGKLKALRDQSDARIAELQGQVTNLRELVGDCAGKEGQDALRVRIVDLEEGKASKGELTDLVSVSDLTVAFEAKQEEWRARTQAGLDLIKVSQSKWAQFWNAFWNWEPPKREKNEEVSE